MSISFTIICVLVFIQQSLVASSKSEGVLERIKNGLQYAKNYLDTAKDIADLVSESLGHSKPKKSTNENSKSDKSSKGHDSENVASAFFRLLGLDSTRIAAIAVNSAIFLAQVISSLFNIQPDAEKLESTREATNKFDPFQFFFNTRNEKFQYLLKQAQNPELPQRLIDQLDGFDSECIRLLMCKTSPIILAAQVSLKNQTVNKRFDVTSWLPGREVFENNSDACERKHRDCNIFPESEEEW